MLEVSFDNVAEDSEEIVDNAYKLKELIKKLKEKCAAAGKVGKMKIISLVFNTWTHHIIATVFNMSDHLVRITRDLVIDQGILSELGMKNCFGIQPQMVTTICGFYGRDDYYV
ncbi:hypothetical protein PR048_012068 [Dryococelus australis]|uniref:Uncharacterized protein n=1 Tax=Dryococelus australis TaxID=614101 RepID=A0ABQ9HNP3_9NEOP|nr:hypothetical protein PR048_012068 [Dryococelus australis]